MKLLFDANLSPSLVIRLRSEYPDSTHVGDVGLRAGTDAQIWEHAKTNELIIVSKDTDFRERSFVEGAPPKVIWLDVGNASNWTDRCALAEGANPRRGFRQGHRYLTPDLVHRSQRDIRSVSTGELMKVLTMILACVSAASSAAAQTGDRNDSSPVIVQMSYYALPGKEDEVLRLRLLAADVLVKRGLNRGRVWRAMDNPRATREPAGPTVIWQGEFANDAMLQQYEEVADKDPDFLAIRRQMGTVTVATRTERRYYREGR